MHQHGMRMVILPLHNRRRGRSSIALLVGISVAVIIVLGSFLTGALSRTIDVVIVDLLVKPLALTVQAQMRSHLFIENRFHDWGDPMSTMHFDEFLNEIKPLGIIRRVNILNTDRVLVFSTEPQDVGSVMRNPEVDRALLGELVLEKPEHEDISNTALDGVIEIYIPAAPEGAGAAVQGVVSVYIDGGALFTFRDRLYFLVFLFVLAVILTFGVVTYMGLRGQSIFIRRQADELRTIVDKAPVGICIINKKGVVEILNPKMAELAGAQGSGEAIGVNVVELPAYTGSGMGGFIEQGMAGKAFEQEAEYVLPASGVPLWRRYHGVPLSDATGGRVERLLLIVEDMTQRKRFERELEQVITDKTKELYEKIDELEKFKAAMIGRELKMIELKKMIETIKQPIIPHEEDSVNKK